MSHYLVSDADFLQPEIIQAKNGKAAVADYATDPDGVPVEGEYVVYTLRTTEPKTLAVRVENRVIIE